MLEIGPIRAPLSLFARLTYPLVPAAVATGVARGRPPGWPRPSTGIPDLLAADSVARERRVV